MCLYYMKAIFLLMLACCTYSTYAQTKTLYQKEVNGKTVWVEHTEPTRTFVNKEGKKVTFTYVEQMPKASYDYEVYIQEHLIYPPELKTENINGHVAVRFIVKSTGEIDSATIVGKSLHPLADQEVVRVVSSMPPWTAGKQNGRFVDVMYTVKVQFRSEDQ